MYTSAIENVLKSPMTSGFLTIFYVNIREYVIGNGVRTTTDAIIKLSRGMLLPCFSFMLHRAVKVELRIMIPLAIMMLIIDEIVFYYVNPMINIHYHGITYEDL